MLSNELIDTCCQNCCNFSYWLNMLLLRPTKCTSWGISLKYHVGYSVSRDLATIVFQLCFNNNDCLKAAVKINLVIYICFLCFIWCNFKGNVCMMCFCWCSTSKMSSMMSQNISKRQVEVDWASTIIAGTVIVPTQITKSSFILLIISYSSSLQKSVMERSIRVDTLR